MSLPDGFIKCNCPACLRPEMLKMVTAKNTATTIACTCGFLVHVPPGPNPAQEVALEIIGANELGECQVGDRRLAVHEGEAQDVIPADERECP